MALTRGARVLVWYDLFDVLKSGNERVIRIAVSNVPINPTIAITTSNKIHLFNESGDKHQYELSRSITPTCIEWHPFHPILAIGWDNGTN